MNSKYLIRKICFFFYIWLVALQTYASPVEFVFQDKVGGWTPCYLNGTCPLMPGVNVGDSITVTVIADNGASNLANQMWYQSDIISAFAEVGSYSGTFTFPFYIYDPVFTTDASSNVASVWFYDTDLGNPDSLGNSINLTSNALTSIRSDNTIQYWAFFQNGTSNSSAHLDFWSVSTVPEPTTILLLSIGFVGLYRVKSAIHINYQ